MSLTLDRAHGGHMSVAAEISTRMVQLLSSYTGRGPTKARTTINSNVIVVVTDDTLTTAERSLVQAGQSGTVYDMRRRFHEVMRQDAVTAVEEISGRKVRSFLSDIAPEDNVAAHVFVLEPLPEPVPMSVVPDPDAGA